MALLAFVIGNDPRPFLTPGGWFLATILLVVAWNVWRLRTDVSHITQPARDLLDAARTERGTAQLVRDDAKSVAADVIHTAAKVAATAAVAAVKVVSGDDVRGRNTRTNEV